MEISYSQRLEDYYLSLAFAGERSGFYVDIGAGRATDAAERPAVGQCSEHAASPRARPHHLRSGRTDRYQAVVGTQQRPYRSDIRLGKTPEAYRLAIGVRRPGFNRPEVAAYGDTRARLQRLDFGHAAPTWQR